MTSRTCSFPGASYSIYTGSCGQQPSLPPSFKAENTKLLLLLLLPVQYMHRSQIDMENNKPPSSCISPAATSVSAGESSWAMDIADFLAAPHGSEDMDQEAASDSSISSGFSSSFDSLGDDDASFITSELMSDDEENDGSLQDTACSSAAGSKITSSMENVDMKSKAPSIDEKEFQMPQLAKYSVDLPCTTSSQFDCIQLSFIYRGLLSAENLQMVEVSSRNDNVIQLSIQLSKDT